MFFEVVLIVGVFLSTIIYCCPTLERPCTTPNGTKGSCILPKYCPNIHRLVGSATSEELEFITSSICGYDVDKSRLFCCDINEVMPGSQEEQVNILGNQRQSNITSQKVDQKDNVAVEVFKQKTVSNSLAIDSSPLHNADYCQTPNGERAECVSIFRCPKLFSIIQNRTNENEKRYLRESKCGLKNDNYLVCCGTDTNFKTFEEDDENRNFTFNHVIPRSSCGIENLTLPNRIFGGNDTEIGEFPWLALLEYETPTRERVFYCGGSLISARYVLTAAHCILGQQAETIVNVRLGEWNYNNTSGACVTTNRGLVCPNAPVDVGIESLHPHPGYKPGIGPKYHDIGLIKLRKNVEFGSHINPICLPSIDEYLAPGEKLTISGWGLKNFKEATSVQQKVYVPVVPRSQCSLMFEKNFRLIKLGSGQFCAGGEAGKDACAGDSGAPLMKRSDPTPTAPPRWYIAGIVSFGHGCGVENQYGVYTKVSKYIGWIHKTVVA